VAALQGAELGFRFEFDADVFDAASIETLVGRFLAQKVGGDDRGHARRAACYL